VANIKSAEKRNRQNEKRNSRNSSVKSSIRTTSKKLEKAIASVDAQSASTAAEIFKKYVSLADSSARKNVVHWKTIARKKSRFSKKINALKAK